MRFVLVLSACSLVAQPSPELSPQLNADDLNKLCVRMTQLMDAGGVAMPSLSRSVDPLIANVKQSCTKLQAAPDAGEPTYALLAAVRAYIALTDVLPKPYPFPETANDQLREVRDGLARLDAHFRAVLDGKELALRTPDRDLISRYMDANRLVAPPEQGKRRVVFLGDTVTAAWRVNEYFPDEDFLNRSIPGQLTGQLLGRLRADALKLQPTAVVIQGGGFDLARGIPVIPIEDNYLSLAELAQANNVRVLFASVLPVNEAQAVSRPPVLIRALNDWLKALCAQRGFTYIDYYSVLADAQGMLLPDVSDDGIVPNAKGYRLMAPVLAQAVADATRARQSAAPPPAAAPPKRR